MNISRRGLITGLTCFIASPAIVRATSIMPVRAAPALVPMDLEWIPQWIPTPETRTIRFLVRFAEPGVSKNVTYDPIGRCVVKEEFYYEGREGRGVVPSDSVPDHRET